MKQGVRKNLSGGQTTINVICACFGSIVAQAQGQVWEWWLWMLTKQCDKVVVAGRGSREGCSIDEYGGVELEHCW